MEMPRRWYTVFRDVAHVAVAALACVFLEFLSRNGILPPAFMSTIAILLVAVCVPFAVVKGLVRPLRSNTPPTRGRVVYAGIFGSVGILLFCGVLLGLVMFVGTVSYSISGTGMVDEEHATYAEVQKGGLASHFKLESMIPSTSTAIRLKGHAGGLLPLGHVQFRCHVSEADFRSFAAERGYSLSTNVFRNVNVEIVDGDRYPAEMDMSSIAGWLFPEIDKYPRHYLAYWHGYRNYGGLILAFDLDAQTLYGSYSTN